MQIAPKQAKVYQVAGIPPEEAVAAVARHTTITAAARALGVSRNRLKRALAKPEAKTLRADVRQRIADGIRDAADEALRVLRGLIYAEDSRVQYQAAVKLLEYLVDERIPVQTSGDAATDTDRARLIEDVIAAAERSRQAHVPEEREA